MICKNKSTFNIISKRIACKNCNQTIAEIKKTIDVDAYIVKFISTEYQYNINKSCLHCHQSWV